MVRTTTLLRRLGGQITWLTEAKNTILLGGSIQRKIVSPLIKEFFYKRGFAERATSAITLEEVTTAVLKQLDAASKPNAVPYIKLAWPNNIPSVAKKRDRFIVEFLTAGNLV